MKKHYCLVDRGWISYEGECNWCGEKEQKVKYIDPPEGWRYGFPKEIPEHVDDTRSWLVANGYPQKEIDALGDSFYVRLWWSYEDK